MVTTFSAILKKSHKEWRLFKVLFISTSGHTGSLNLSCHDKLRSYSKNSFIFFVIRNPPGTIIVIENVVAAPGQPTESIVTKKEVTLPGTGKKLPAAPKMSDRCGSSAAPRSRSRLENERRSYSLPRPKSSLSRIGPVVGTGRRLPPTPHQAALPLQHAPVKRKRELPKPASLELRHSNREVMNASNAGLGFCGRSSRSMNFPRLDGSPTHSEDSGDEGSGFAPIIPSAPLRSGVYPSSRRVEYWRTTLPQMYLGPNFFCWTFGGWFWTKSSLKVLLSFEFVKLDANVTYEWRRHNDVVTWRHNDVGVTSAMRKFISISIVVKEGSQKGAKNLFLDFLRNFCKSLFVVAPSNMRDFTAVWPDWIPLNWNCFLVTLLSADFC